MNKYRFIVEKFDKDKVSWVYDSSFFDIYFAHCYVLKERQNSNNKYRILEVVDLYV